MKEDFDNSAVEPLFSLAPGGRVPINLVRKQLVELFFQLIGFTFICGTESLAYSDPYLSCVWVDPNWVPKDYSPCVPALRPA
jgi:alkyl hydroperoxide reductase subunit AhpC